MGTLAHSKNLQSFNYLYDAYAPALYGLIIKLTPESDVACDILLKSFRHIWVNIDEYDAEKERLLNWMIAITIKQCSETLCLPKNYLLGKIVGKPFYDGVEIMGAI